MIGISELGILVLICGFITLAAASAEEAYVAKVEPDPACTTAGIWFRRIANGTIHLNWGTGAGCWVADIGTTQTVSSNAWHHVALVKWSND